MNLSAGVLTQATHMLAAMLGPSSQPKQHSVTVFMAHPRVRVAVPGYE